VPELDVPYLDIFYPLQESAIWMSEAAANDGSTRLSWLYELLGTKLVLVVLVQCTSLSEVGDVLQGGRTPTWMKTAWIRN